MAVKFDPVLGQLRTSDVTPGGGSDKYYTTTFTSVSSISVAHNLGKFPSVSVLDTALDQCEGTIVHTDVNNLTVTFSAPFSGTITCN